MKQLPDDAAGQVRLILQEHQRACGLEADQASHCHHLLATKFSIKQSNKSMQNTIAAQQSK
jgi:hypothetical protein